jgi:centromeric protein E
MGRKKLSCARTASAEFMQARSRKRSSRARRSYFESLLEETRPEGLPARSSMPEVPEATQSSRLLWKAENESPVMPEVRTLSLIDLAGSEKAAETKERRTEGSHINKSLLTLGTVIAKLSEHKDKDGKPADKDGKHLPYRDSKLTRLLQGALSGNSLVSILCTIQIGSAGSVASANSHTTETLNTLKFASRAKNNIVSHAKKAEEALGAGGDGGARVLLERYRMEILELRQQLETQAKSKEKESDEEEKVRVVEEEREREKEAENRHEEQMLEMQLARTALKERIDHLNRLILSSKSIGVNSSGSYSSLGMHPRFSQASVSARSSMATSNSGRPIMDRTSSMTSASSTVGRRSSGGQRVSSGESGGVEDEDSAGEFGDGTASLASQNRALQADLADKTRYIATLEKRLMQARRASSSRTSVGFSAPSKGIMVGEDHSVSSLLKEKDAEIAELRARLDDKDRMLGALRSAARSRDTAEAHGEGRASQVFDIAPQSASPTASHPPHLVGPKKRTKSGDGMRILEEMIQDRVETGQIIRGVRGSVRVASDRRLEVLMEPTVVLDPMTQSPAALGETAPAVALEV